MPLFSEIEPQEFRIVYWGSESAGLIQSLDGIAETSPPHESAKRTRVVTSLDPSSCYETLSLHFGEPASAQSTFHLIAAPSAPELAPVRMQLLDRADAIVILVEMAPGQEHHDTTQLNELRSALAAYGRLLDDLPLAVQYTGRDWVEPMDVERLLQEFDIAPVAVHEAIQATKTSFRGVLQGLARALEEPEPPYSAPLASEPMGFPSIEEDDPWLAPPDAYPTEDESAISAMLEASILDESEISAENPVGPAQAFSGDGEDESGEPTGDLTHPSPHFEIASVGTAVRAGNRGVRIPLALSGPEGEPVPLTLHIELEAVLGEREP